MPHDFDAFPELRSGEEMDVYYFLSPHKQILEDFSALCVKVHDGDTITLRWNERDFDFPLRFINIAAPEISDTIIRPSAFNAGAGKDARAWLENRILNKMVDIKINPLNRVEKWGRLLGNVIFNGADIGEEEVWAGKAVFWENKNDGIIPSFKIQMEQLNKA